MTKAQNQNDEPAALVIGHSSLIRISGLVIRTSAMIEQTPFIPTRPRRHRRQRPPAATPVPPALNQITSVAYGPAPEVLIVAVTGTLVALGELEGVVAVTSLGHPSTPIEANLD